MQTRTVELTKQWILVTTGPATFISFEPGKRGRSTALQIVISSTTPPDGTEGHEISGLVNAVLDAGENLYARSNGNVGSMIITDALPSTLMAERAPVNSFEKDTQQKLKVASDNQKSQGKLGNKAGDTNG